MGYSITTISIYIYIYITYFLFVLTKQVTWQKRHHLPMLTSPNYGRVLIVDSVFGGGGVSLDDQLLAVWWNAKIMVPTKWPHRQCCSLKALPPGFQHGPFPLRVLSTREGFQKSTEKRNENEIGRKRQNRMEFKSYTPNLSLFLSLSIYI